MSKQYISVLSVAGSDCSGGAGVQADLKTFSALGCYGMTAITAITAQNTTGVTMVQGIDPQVVEAQIDMVTADIPPRAIKTGMLYSAPVAESVARSLRRYIPVTSTPLVVDPVMVSTSGSRLITREAVDVIVGNIFPIATLVTPNLSEARELTGCDDPASQWSAFRQMGCRNVLLKGGDSDRSDVKIDFLGLDGSQELIEISSPAVTTANTHGTGCTLSAAIASFLAMGQDLLQAVKSAKAYITSALIAGADVDTGSGHGPVNHFFSPVPLHTTES